jgi:D-alanine-D-alanine ligase
MKVAIVYNRESERVINLFGLPNREKYGKASIKRISDALKKGGHQVKAFEGDKDLIDRLEEFMPRVVKGERPGMVFNVSYGIQGQARYTHVPSILEMIGIPYVGSGPEAHSLSLDKVVAKMIFHQHGVPTPDFAVLYGPTIEPPDLEYPLIVKPRSEAVSFGIKVVNTDEELKEAAGAIFEAFQQPVLVERYIEGREINVGIIGNDPPEMFPPAELDFGKGGPAIYTWEDKTRQSGREIEVVCPARIDDDISQKAQETAQRAFLALGCYDCARVDMRLDSDDNLYVLEINSLPSLGEHGSYLQGAAKHGLDFSALVNRLVEVATARYFGVSNPTSTERKDDPKNAVFNFLIENRDRLEDRTKELVSLSSRTADPVGLAEVKRELGATFSNLGLKPVKEFTDNRVTWLWESKAGFQDGTLLIGHVDIPLGMDVPRQGFRRDPESLYGEGIGSSRAPLAMVEYALRAIRRVKRLHRTPVGVMYYTDEGRDCRYSAELIRAAASKAKRVLVMRPSLGGRHIIASRRGMRTYVLTAEGKPLRLGEAVKKKDVLRWLIGRLDEFSGLSSKENRLSVMPVDVKAQRIPMRLPNEASATILLTYPDKDIADDTEARMRGLLGTNAFRWRLQTVSDRPPMAASRKNTNLAKSLKRIADEWEISIRVQSSASPSAAGLIPKTVPALCGLGPICNDLYTPHESVRRSSLLKRTLLLAQFLISNLER